MTTPWIATTLIAGYFLFMYVFYFSHRIVHGKWWKWAHEAHVNGHHRDEDYRYTVHLKVNLIDAAFAGPILTLFWLVLPPSYFWILFAEALLMSALSTWIHISFHTRGHWLNRSPRLIQKWYKEAKRLHFLHHPHMDHNLSLLASWPDKLHGTYLSGRPFAVKNGGADAR